MEENNVIDVYVERDDKGSIINLISSVFIVELNDRYEKVDSIENGTPYENNLYAHAGNGQYVLEKYGKSLYDELGRPNYHDDFLLWTDEEKEKLYPISQEDDSIDELEQLKERQMILENALQDMILMTMKGGDE